MTKCHSERCLYLGNGISKLIVVVIESCIQLCLAPGSDDPDELLIIVVFVFDFLMKYLGLSFCQWHVHLIPLISESTHKRNQKL